MIKKTMLLAVSAAAVVAFAVPVAAQATPLIHNEAGNDPGTIFALSENTVRKTQAGEFQCQTVVLEINLSENATTTAHGSGGGEAFGTPPAHEGPCWNPQLQQHVNVTRVAVNAIHLEDTGTGSATLEQDYEVPSLFFCTEIISAAISYKPGANKFRLSGGLSPTAGGCPAGTVAGDFELQGGVTIG